MLAKEIFLQNFNNHDHTIIRLPATGVTVITGTNGSGKSSLVEAVSYAHWGRTLRDKPPWRPGVAGSVRVITDQVDTRQSINRSGKRDIEWCRAGEDTLLQFDKPSDSRKALIAEVGEFELWRKTHVFSSADASLFSNATDKTRKELIEDVLGLDVFDEALIKCRADIKEATTKLTGLELAQARLVSDQHWALKALQPWAPGVAPVKPELTTNSGIDKLQTLLDGLAVQLASHRRVTSESLDPELFTNVAGGESALATAHVTLSAVASGKCATCGADVTHDDIAKFTDNVALWEENLRDGRTELREARAHLADCKAHSREQTDKLNVNVATFRRDLSREKEEAAALAQWTKNRDQWEAQEATRHAVWKIKHDTQLARVLSISEALEDIEDLIDRAHPELAELHEAEKALGLRGIRVQVLAGALGGIEHVANGWLSRLSPHMKIELKPYTETKKGTVNDTLNLIVHGAGGGYGHGAASGGERRRVDVSLVLGLAEVEEAAAGKGEGTLFFDEIFDALDAEGCQRVAECLTELGETRSVVVITHLPALAELLKHATHYEAHNGVLSYIDAPD